MSQIRYYARISCDIYYIFISPVLVEYITGIMDNTVSSDQHDTVDSHGLSAIQTAQPFDCALLNFDEA